MGGSAQLTLISPLLCGGSSTSSISRKLLDPQASVLLSPFEEASGLVDSRRTLVPSTAHMGLPELALPWVPDSSRVSGTQVMRADPGGNAEPSVSTGVGLVRAVSRLFFKSPAAWVALRMFL